MNLVITEQKKSKLRDPNVYKMFIPPFAGKAVHIMERKKKTNQSRPLDFQKTYLNHVSRAA